jgi:hypothetical protein
MRGSIRIALVLGAMALWPRPAAAQEQGQEPIRTGFHAGVGLSIHQSIISDETDLVPELELGVIAGGIVDVYLDLGLDIEHESFKDGNRELTSTAGALMPEVGVRFIIGKPRPRSAFFYAGIAVTPVIGIASYKSDGSDADDRYYEDRVREYMDRFDIGVLLGVEYLIARSFGIGAEAGFVTSINNLKKTNVDEPDKHVQVGFFVPFSIRAAYHF